MPEIKPVRLLIVDDEAPQMNGLSMTLQDAGYTTTGFTLPQEALALLAREPFDLLLTDLKMPGMDGLSLLRAALEIDRDLVVIVMTGHGTIDTAVEAMKAGALDYILKPFRMGAILPILDRACAMRKLRVENASLARRVAQRTLELEAANKELEAFSYSVSHDLHAPLRHVELSAGMLLDNFAAEIPPDGLRYLKTITNSVQRMSQLIDDLLRLSRFGRQRLSTKRVELSGLVQSVLDELSGENPHRKMDLRVASLPACQGDPSLLRQVWVNLLSNAFKFTGKTEKPEIEIGWTKEGSELVYFVRDNGVGFDMQNVDKLFGVFQRLHGSKEFAGTGVGLSIVQRIIQRHGGRIWVQAAMNEGATFYFTLPGTET